MFDLAWSELAVIAIVALVVIGPKDLPRVLKNVGFWVRKARGIAREFQSSLEQMAHEAELDDVKKNLEKATNFNLNEEIKKAVDPSGEIENSIAAPELTGALNPATPAETVADTVPEASPAPELPPAEKPPELPSDVPPLPSEKGASEKVAGKTP